MDADGAKDVLVDVLEWCVDVQFFDATPIDVLNEVLQGLRDGRLLVVDADEFGHPAAKDWQLSQERENKVRVALPVTQVVGEFSGPISKRAAKALYVRPDAAPQAKTGGFKEDPYMFRRVPPLPEIDYNNPLNYHFGSGDVVLQGRVAPEPEPQPANNGWPSYIKWRDQTPPPPKLGTGIKTEASSIKPYIDIEIGHDGKKYSGYVDVRDNLILASDFEAIANKMKAVDGNGWPDYIQWHPSAPESPPTIAAITILDECQFAFFDKGGNTTKFGIVRQTSESDFAKFMDGLHVAHKATKRPRIYIAGPMSGLPELNFPAFHAEAARLRALGYEVVNPAEINAEHPGDWASCLKADIAQMLTCDGIAMLHGWTESRGATLEHSLAQTLGMVIHYKAITQEVL